MGQQLKSRVKRQRRQAWIKRKKAVARKTAAKPAAKSAVKTAAKTASK